MKIVSGAATDTGQVRELNEDSYLVDRRLELFAIADGMGGHRAGEVASATALERLRTAVDTGVSIAESVGFANTAVWDKAAADTSLAGMGTTLTAARSDGSTLTVAHVGDSRAYLLRDDVLQRITVDHSLVEELIRDGRLTEEQAAVHPQRSIITRALGIDSSVEVDVYSLVLQPNDRVMLCSDGLTSMVREGGIAEILRQDSDPTAAANSLVDAANDAGGDDNITVVVLDARSDGKDPLPKSVAAAIAAKATATTSVSEVGATDATAVELVAGAAVTVVTTGTSLDGARAGGPPTAPEAPAPAKLPRDTARFRDPRPPSGRVSRRAGRGIRRALFFAVPILLILGIAIATIGWYANNSYFVTFDAKQQVVIYRGRPGGLPFWDPKLVRNTGVKKAELTQIGARAVATRKDDFTTLRDAEAFVKRARTARIVTPSATTATTAIPTAPPAP